MRQTSFLVRHAHRAKRGDEIAERLRPTPSENKDRIASAN